MQNVYGMSEHYEISSMKPGEQHIKTNSVGKAWPQVEVKIVDENGETVPRNKEGELWVRSCGSFLEYTGLEEKTRETLTVDGWVKTG